MKNPIKVIREEKRLTAKELAMIARVSYMAIGRLEQGLTLKVPEKVLDAVEKLGYDRKKVDADYNAWLNNEVAKLEKRVQQLSQK